jgi:hypothetical protein
MSEDRMIAFEYHAKYIYSEHINEFGPVLPKIDTGDDRTSYPGVISAYLLIYFLDLIFLSSNVEVNCGT